MNSTATEILTQLEKTRADTRAGLLKWVVAGEVLCLFAAFITQTFFGGLVEQMVSPPNVLLSNCGIAVLLALSFVRFQDSPGKSLGLVLFELFVLTVSAAYGVPRLFVFVYMFYVARAGILLSQKQMWIVVLTCVLFYTGGKELRYWLTERYIYAIPVEQHILHLLVAARVVAFALGLVLVAFFVAALLAEREKKLARQRLNDEVQAKAAQVERTRMAREIHDSAGHLMASMCMQLDVAMAAREKSREKSLPPLDIVCSLVPQLRSELSLLEVSPQDSRSDFKAGIDSLVELYERESVFSFHVVPDSIPSIDEKMTHDLFSVIKEACHNVKKYAGARDVWLNFVQDDAGLLVEVRDNGKGFDTARVKKTSYGLRGMRERMDKYGAMIEVESSEGKGTRVLIRVPKVKG